MASAGPDASLGALLGELAQRTGLLVRQEVQLAKTEAAAQVAIAGKDAALILVGGALAHAGFIAVMFAIVFAAGRLVPMWIPALVVGIVIVGVGLGLVQRSLHSLRSVDPIRRTRETLREDKVLLEEQVR